MSAKNVAAVVVWFNPCMESAINAIRSYEKQVDKVYVVDNSDNSLIDRHKNSINEFENIEYHPLGANLGIAKALNVGFQKAISEGYPYVITLDQDSSASSDMVSKLVSAATELNRDRTEYGIIAAQPDTPSRAERKKDGFTEMESVIASGNLVVADAFREVGGFKEELFIDYVDCWFSLDMRKHGYKIVQVNDAKLLHHLGSIVERSLFGIKMYPTNHSPIRSYYIARNRLYTKKEFGRFFPKYFRHEKLNYLKFIIKIVLFERNKVAKIKRMMRGASDYRKGIMGGFREKR